MQSMDNHTQPADSNDSASQIMSYLLTFAGIFTLSWLVTFGWYNRELFIDLYALANLERYQVATGDTGPATFHVYHTDYQALERLSQTNSEILGIEMTKNKHMVAMAFTSNEVTAINTVRAHPAVSNMIRRNIPMLCH